MSFDLRHLSETRQSLVRAMKERGSASIAELAEALELSEEAIRQQLGRLVSEGWAQKTHENRPGAGRPTALYSLTQAGEHLFPKDYASLTVELIDTLIENIGQEGLKKLLATMTDRRVREWKPILKDLSLKEKLIKLKDIYRENDEQMEVREEEDALYLIENNCPFLDVAVERPAVCSLTVSTLSRLLGHPVTRTERFQDGHGRCVFKVDPDQSVDETFRFALEEEQRSAE